MVRRLSITVPDELWDGLTHLDPSPSSLVQRALRCLSDSEGLGASSTQLEDAAAGIPHWQSVLDNLTEEAIESRSQGYEVMIQAIHQGDMHLRGLELVSQGRPADQVPGVLMFAARHFLYVREIGREHLEEQNWPSDGKDKYSRREKKLRDTDFLFGDCDGFTYAIDMGWDRNEIELLEWLFGLFIGRMEGGSSCLMHLQNSVSFDPSRLPATDIPLSFFEGMAAAIVDIIATVRRRVRAESNPAMFGSFQP